MNDITYFNDLIGKTLVLVAQGTCDGTDTIVFVTNEEKVWLMYHSQDCCECVEIESIVGELSDLVGVPLNMAEEVSNHTENSYGDEQWTFYKFATIKGYVDIRWFGSSNGYYSTSVDFEEKNLEWVTENFKPTGNISMVRQELK